MKDSWFARHPFLKNVILIACSIIVMTFAAHLLLGLFTHHNRHLTVPDFTGMSLAEARAAGSGGKLRIEVNDSVFHEKYAPGAILAQRPAALTEVKSGRRVMVTINATQPRMVRIPYVTGVSRRQAENDLRTAGFKIREIIYKPDIATDYVLETRYEGRRVTRDGGMVAPQGAGITLVVGRNGNG